MIKPNTYIDNPNYVNPDYKINYFNNKKLNKESENIDLYLSQYNNNLKVNQNYQTDLSASTLLLKYLDNYQSKINVPVNLDYSNRQLEINNYYIMKYRSESYILKLIIFFCGMALIGCFFFLKGFIGESLYVTYLGIIISIGIFVIIYNIYYLLYRDNIRYDEYNYGNMSYPGRDMHKHSNEISSDGNTYKKSHDNCSGSISSDGNCSDISRDTEIKCV